jgi:hypothetical protein
MTTRRERFEAWIQYKAPGISILRRDMRGSERLGQYVDTGVELAWCAWNESQPEFSQTGQDDVDSVRTDLLWVLWHHQGGSSPIGQPIRIGLGIGQFERLSSEQVEQVKRWGEKTGLTPGCCQATIEAVPAIAAMDGKRHVVPLIYRLRNLADQVKRFGNLANYGGDVTATLNEAAACLDARARELDATQAAAQAVALTRGLSSDEYAAINQGRRGPPHPPFANEVPSAGVPCVQDITQEPWGSIKVLLDGYPKAIRSRYKGFEEDLLGSLCITWYGMLNEINRLKNAKGETA